MVIDSIRVRREHRHEKWKRIINFQSSLFMFIGFNNRMSLSSALEFWWQSPLKNMSCFPSKVRNKLYSAGHIEYICLENDGYIVRLNICLLRSFCILGFILKFWLCLNPHVLLNLLPSCVFDCFPFVMCFSSVQLSPPPFVFKSCLPSLLCCLVLSVSGNHSSNIILVSLLLHDQDWWFVSNFCVWGFVPLLSCLDSLFLTLF